MRQAWCGPRGAPRTIPSGHAAVISWPATAQIRRKPELRIAQGLGTGEAAMGATTEQQLAELRRANETLQRERDAARAELRRCVAQTAVAYLEIVKAENEELRAAQAAGLEVLQAMAASPGQTEPVFDLIAQQAAKLCEAPIATVGIFDGSMVHLVTQSGFDDAYTQLFGSQFPREASADFAMGRAILSGRIEQIEDTGTADRNGFKPPPGPGSALAVPLMRNGARLGVIAVGRRVTGPFPRNQVALLRTFAEQAVIAITSSETYRALAQRNSEYGERIEHQSATIDVLKAMSASPGDPQPVFDLIVRHAQAQCNSANAAFYEYDGMIHCRSIVSNVLSNEGLEAYVNRFPMPLEQEPDNGVSVSIRSGRVVHIRDANAEGGMSAWARSQGVQSGIAVPMIRAGRALGCIVLTELRPGGYSDSQVELLKTFAEQAVIAISSAETYRALAQRNSAFGERIVQQAATIDVLKS